MVSGVQPQVNRGEIKFLRVPVELAVGTQAV